MIGARAFSTIVVAGVLAAITVGCFGKKDRPIRLQGAGSSFVDPMMQIWRDAYKDNGEINYQSKGSGAGIAMMTSKDVDFGCSDAPLNDEQLAKAKSEGGEVLHIPLCMGAVVPAYNLEGRPELTFSGQLLADIYMGKVTRWNDEAIVKLNPTQKDNLPNLPISVIYRSDSSGTTYVWTDYLTKIDPQGWAPKRGTAVKFEVGNGAKGNEGVSGLITQSKGSLGYIELTYALKNNITYGKVINSKGNVIKAELASVTAAAANADIPDDLRYSITNAPGDNAYPIAGTVWAIVFVKQPARKAESLRDFLHWITHEGQKLTDQLHYAALPDALVKKIEAKLKLIEAK